MTTLSSLVIAAQQGDFAAFSAVVQRFRVMAYATAYMMLEDVHLAEDATQEAFIEAYLHLPKLREPDAFPGWLRRIVFKQSDRLIRGKQLKTVPLEATPTFDIPADDFNPALLVEGMEMRDSVRQAIATLPEHERLVIALFYGGGYALKEIASFLEVAQTTVKKRLFDARKHLKAHLQNIDLERPQDQEAMNEELFSERIRLLSAIRSGEREKVQALLEQHPFLINGNLLQYPQTRSKYPFLRTAHRPSSPEESVYQDSPKRSSDFASGGKGTQQRPTSFPLAVKSTALYEAITHDQPELVMLLLNYGANSNARIAGGLTPLIQAILNDQPDTVALLLLRGAYAHLPSTSGLLPLHIAALRDCRESAEILLEHGAAIDATDRAGRTALHWAALKGHVELVQLLLARGATTSLQDELGWTAARWTQERGYHSVSDLLQKDVFTASPKT